MADMGFRGVVRDVMRMVYKIAERSERKHLFRGGSAGCVRFNGLLCLTLDTNSTLNLMVGS